MLFATQLVGLGVGGAAAPTTLTQVASVTSVTQTLTIPATAQPGDLLVFYSLFAWALSDPGAFVPTNFTSINQLLSAATKARVTLCAKIVQAGEPGTNITMGTADAWFNHLYVFRGDNPISNFSALDAAGESTAGNPTAQVVEAASGLPPLVVIGTYSSNNAVNPRTFSTTKDGEITADGTDIWLAYKIYNSAPANSSIDMDDEGDGQMLQSCYITVS